MKSRRFNSQFYHPRAEWVNCLTTHWEDELNWVHPPYGNMGAAILHLIYCKANATLIIPEWRGAHWWHLLFPREGVKAHFVKEVRHLGPSTDVLHYEGGERCDMPKANNILALRLAF